ncbi:MAG TPA: DivIVA domain-containing protein [Candidatus Pullichristensenella stercorigallinarum]|uniref:DivIVA domain-containing protein n=1 Tax=Candidatus Pullichristensenella stercorigallinarum TaxID=2840909 RepID=A0A9D0ZNG6_9FIRM|nr:DivIVA domain-containing protein [Candidatus Pullichristensenella stercorigallinarum]
MPISVRDIQEKEFSRQKRDGYNIEEVDDFLDEISDQLSVLIRENMALAEQVKTLQAENEKLAASANAPAVEAAPTPAPTPAPAPVETVASTETAYDEPSYFKNLELAMRDTLVNAQRIADDTVAEARKKAQELISSAEEQAATTVSNAKVEAEGVKAEADNIRKTIATYRANFRRLVEGQVQVLKETDSLFD